MRIFRILPWLVIGGLGFWAGVAWKSEDNAVKTFAPGAAATKTSVSLRPDLNSDEVATINLFEKAAPSVVFITTSTFQQDYYTRNVTEIPQGSGSGFIWDNQGHVITNYHVIQRAQGAKVTLSDATTWDAELVGYAAEKDLAVLKIKAPVGKLIPIPVANSDDLRVGQSVFAIGNPFGLDQTLTTGIISALGREIESVAGTPIKDVIQTDAAINPGNSGGPLLNSSGRLIGVNTAIYSPSGAYAGIGFSIPSDAVSWVIPELIRYGQLQRPTIGVELLHPTYTQRLGIKGAIIAGVVPGSAAAKVGMKPITRDQYGNFQLGDIIIAINGNKIDSNGDLMPALEKFKPGDQVTLRIVRGDKQMDLSIKLDPPRH